MESEKFKKLNISIPPDLYRWIKKKQDDLKKLHPLGRFDVSPIIADCILAMMKSEEGKGHASPAGAKEVRLSESSGTGSSTRTKKTSRKTG
ncbi:MAG: hypothetical protein EBS96_12730 [Spartobacteria bacterium]|nr:hypothetical protein [Spartobacteria bacterium]